MGECCVCVCVCVCVFLLSRFSHIWLFSTPGTVALQATLSAGFSKQEYWSGLPCPPPGDPLDPGIEPEPFTSPAEAGGFFTTRASWEAPVCMLTPLLYIAGGLETGT